jgi:hypothetical protein
MKSFSPSLIAGLALREILVRDPWQVEALTLMGYIETRLEDYAVAANC